MTTQFESFDQSPGGAFIETAFESRGQGEKLPAGCCCRQHGEWILPTSQTPGHFVFHRLCRTRRWGPRVWEWACLEDPNQPNDSPLPRPPMDRRPILVPDEATAEGLCLGIPEGEFVRRHCEDLGIDVPTGSLGPLGPPSWPYAPRHGLMGWNAPCHCQSASGQAEDFEEQCDHLEGYCCALVLNRWELSPEGDATWAQHCTAEAHQKYYEDPIEDIRFTADPEDPDHPCPPDPSGRGWCCVLMSDGTTFHANPLGEGGNSLEDECTVDFQQQVFGEINPTLLVVAVNWLGQVSDEGCNPCGIDEGSCCLTSVRPFGICMMGMQETECDALPGSTFDSSLDQCANCFEPRGLDPTPDWFEGRGRCCTSFQFWAGSGWVDQWNCGSRTPQDCSSYRAGLRADTDNYQRVVDQGFTPGFECQADPDSPGSFPGERQCSTTEQGWCCGGDRPLRPEWRTRHGCESGSNPGMFFSGLLDPAEVCDPEARQPCCLPDADGVLHCSVELKTECWRLGGIVKGSPGDDCDSVDDDGNLVAECEAGACCLGCSRCTDNMTPWDCAALPGQYRGHGTQCHEIDDCPEGVI